MNYGLSLCASLISRVAIIRERPTARAIGDRTTQEIGEARRRDLVRPLTVSASLFPLALQLFGMGKRLVLPGIGTTQEIGEAREEEEIW